MPFNVLPSWVQVALKSGPVFGSEGETPSGGDPAGGKPATVDNVPDDKPDADKPVNIDPDEYTRAIQERDNTKNELAALQQEKQQREEQEAQALAATRSKEENLENQVQTLTEDNSKLTLVNTENLLELAILKNNKYEWENHSVAVKLIDRSGIKIDAKTGKVDGVDDALKALAKENPYLLKKAGNGDANPSGGGNPSSLPGQPSGGTPTSSADSSAKANKRKQLENRFQVLRV